MNNLQTPKDFLNNIISQSSSPMAEQQLMLAAMRYYQYVTPSGNINQDAFNNPPVINNIKITIRYIDKCILAIFEEEKPKPTTYEETEILFDYPKEKEESSASPYNKKKEALLNAIPGDLRKRFLPPNSV